MKKSYLSVQFYNVMKLIRWLDSAEGKGSKEKFPLPVFCFFFLYFQYLLDTLVIQFRLLNWKKINPIEKEQEQVGRRREGKGKENGKSMSLVGS